MDLITQTLSLEQGIGMYLSGKAPNTQQSYGKGILLWLTYLSQGQDHSGVMTSTAFRIATPAHAKAWVQGMIKEGMKPATANVYQTAVKGLYNTLIEAKALSFNPFATSITHIPARLRQPEKSPKAMTSEEANRLILSPDINTPLGVRNRAILSLLFGAGLRASEVLNLKVSDIGYSNNVTKLVLRDNKTSNYSEVSISAWVYEALVKHIISAQLLTDDVIFDISYVGLWKMFKRECKKIGLGPGYSPHSARYTGITTLAEKGESYQSIQKFSRHKSTNMIERYHKKIEQLTGNPGLRLKFG